MNIFFRSTLFRIPKTKFSSFGLSDSRVSRRRLSDFAGKNNKRKKRSNEKWRSTDIIPPFHQHPHSHSHWIQQQKSAIHKDRAPFTYHEND